MAHFGEDFSREGDMFACLIFSGVPAYSRLKPVPRHRLDSVGPTLPLDLTLEYAPSSAHR